MADARSVVVQIPQMISAADWGSPVFVTPISRSRVVRPTVYFFDLVQDSPEIGGVAEFAARLFNELRRRLGSRLVSVRDIASSIGGGDPREPYLDRERRAIETLAAVADPDSIFLIPNFQSPLPKRVGVRRPRIVNVVHDVQFAMLPELFTSSQRAWLSDRFAETRANADHVVFVSAATRDHFIGLFGAPARSSVISPPIWVAGRTVPPSPERPPYLLAVQHASCHPHKNVHGLLGLFAGMASRMDGLQLRVAGQGRGAFEAETAHLPEALRARVHHHGFVSPEELDALRRGARAFVSMSRFEGFNMAAAEAAAQGLPLILSDLPAHRELFADVACLLDPDAPSTDAAVAYLAARHGRPSPSWEHGRQCAVDSVGEAYASLTARIERKSAKRLVKLPRSSARGPAVGVAPRTGERRAPVSRTAPLSRLARALLAGTMLSGLSGLGGVLAMLAPERAVAAAILPNAPVGSPGAGGNGGDGVGLAGTGGAGGVLGGDPGGPGTGSPMGGFIYYGGGGGGAGQGTAGRGGNGGTGGTGGPGVIGGIAAGQAGAAGPDGSSLGGGAPYYGGGGGGGGANGGANGLGGNGGNGGNSTSTNQGSAGGGGGGGGIGALLTGDFTNTGTLTGGTGGNGGSGYYGGGGNGGSGGFGVLGNGVNLFNAGSITGGGGGTGGGMGGPANGAPGVGADGVAGANIHVTNFIGTTVGSITGGTAGDGSAQANAINFTAGINRLTLKDDVFSGAPGLSGNINIGSSAAVPTSVLFDQSSRVDLFPGTIITGTGSLIQSGSGLLVLYGNNSYSGGTTLNAGTTTQVIPSDGVNITALGTGAVTFNGGVLQVQNQNLDPTLANAIVLNAAGGTIDAHGAGPLLLTGTITDGAGAGPLTILDSSYVPATPPNPLTLVTFAPSGAPNTYSGGTILGNGDPANPESVEVRIAAANALGTGGLTFMDANSVFDLGGFDQRLATLNGAGGSIINTAFGGTAGVTTNNVLTVAGGSFGGTISDSQFIGSGLTNTGTISLVKVTDGTASGGRLTLSGANAFSGGTTINAGTLSLAHASAAGLIDAAGTGAVTLNGGLLDLAATGTLNLPLNVAATANARIAATPSTTGTLTGALTLGAGSTLQFGTVADTGTIVLAPVATPVVPAGFTLAVAGGTLQAGAGNGALGALTAGAGATTVSGGILDFNGNAATIANLQGSGGAVNNNAGATTTVNAGAYAGSLTGGGDVTKATGSALLLTGTSTFTGALGVVGGTLEVGAGGAIAGSASLANAATFQLDPGGSAAFVTATNTGTFLAAGTLNVTTLNNAGTFNVTGPLAGTITAFNQNGGTFDLGGNAVSLVTLNLSGGTIQNGFLAASTFAVQAGSISAALTGGGVLTKTGAGTVTLSGTNTYTGATTISAGTLALVGAGSLAASSAVVDIGTFDIAGTSAGASITTLSGSGTVALGAQVLTLTAAANRFDGTIAGTGGLTLSSGRQGLAGTNTYTGATTIATGVLALVGAGSIAMSSGVVDNGAFDIAGTNAGASITTLSGAGTVALGAQVLTLTAAANRFDGAIAGAGGLTLASGRQGLAGANTYTGATTISAGTLALVGAGSIAMSSGVVDNGAFDIAGTSAGASITTLSGTGAVALGAQTLTLTAAANRFDGTIAGAGGGLALTGGRELLSGANAYTGGTRLDGGILAVTSSDALGTGPLFFNGGTFEAAANGLTISNPATLLSDGTINTGRFSLSYVGTVSGPGGLIKAGTGTLTLGGANSFTGGTQLDGGTLAVATNTALGTGPLLFNGGMLQAAANKLVLANPVVLQNAGTVDAGRFNLTLGGLISGPGGLVKLGTGTLTLGGDDSYAGGTQLTSGTLAVASNTALGTGSLTFGGGTLAAAANGLALGNAVALAKDGILDTGPNSLTLAGIISGAGTLTKLGTGTLTLGGANTYAGDTLLRVGTIAIGSATALGTGTLRMDDGTTLAFTSDLTLGNAVVFTGVADPTLDTGDNTDSVAGPISGAGALTKLGSGTLILTGTDTYTGATTVAAGSLVVDGSIANSTVTVGDGALLGGSGTVGGIVAGAGATVAPGARAPYGTLNVVGNVALESGSTFRVNVNPQGQNDSLSASGRTTLGGGGLDVVAATGGYSPATQYVILRSAGGLTGTFGSVSVSSGLALLSPTLTYAPTSVTFGFARNQTTFASLGATPNEIATAGAIEPLGPRSPLFNAVLSQTAQGARQAFDAASGEAHASAATTAIADAQFVSTFVFDRLWNVVGTGLSARQLLDQLGPGVPASVRCYAPIPGTTAVAPVSYTLYGEGFGDFGHNGGNGNAAGLDRSLGGFVLGGDTLLTGLGTPWRIGLAGGYTHDDFSVKDRSSSGTFESVFGSAYGGARYGNVDVRVGAAYAGNSTDTRRSVTFPGFSEAEHANYGGSTVQGFGELGYRFQLPRAVIEPVVGAAIIHTQQDKFHETGGAAALIGFAHDTDVETTTLGVRGEVAPVNNLPLVVRAFLGWRHAFGDVDPTAVLAFAAGSNPFTTTGAPIDRDALASEFGVDYKANAAMTLGISYVGQVGERASDNSVKGRLEYRF